MINWNYGTFSGIILDFLGFCVACSYSEEFFNIKSWNRIYSRNVGRHQVSDVSYKQTHKPLGRFLPGSSVKKAWNCLDSWRIINWIKSLLMILKAGMAFLRILFWLGWSLNFLFGWLALATESMWFSILQPDILTEVLPLQILKCPSLTEWFLDWYGERVFSLDEDIVFGCSAFGEDRNWHTLHLISWFRFVTVSNTWVRTNICIKNWEMSLNWTNE